jgi:hypothetical protein
MRAFASRSLASSVGKPYKQWSLLIEVSESKHRHYFDPTKGKQWSLQDLAKDPEELKRVVIDGLHRGDMLPRNASIASVWTKRLEYGYPVPYVERNMHVHTADNALRKLGIWSRGRFGSWKYEVGNQDHSCMLGVDAVDSMLFGGNQEGREATFNSPDYVNGRNRPYDRDFDPAALAREAGRAHTFGLPPRRLRTLAQWDWVLPHCDEKDSWLDQIRKVMVALPTETKWLIHGYEHCGVAEVKRPMLEMLREGLNHHDRIPHPTHSLPLSGWVRHIVAHYKKLPDYVFFAPASIPTTSTVFSATALMQTAQQSRDFGMWGSHVVEMPATRARPRALKASLLRTCKRPCYAHAHVLLLPCCARSPHRLLRQALALCDQGAQAQLPRASGDDGGRGDDGFEAAYSERAAVDVARAREVAQRPQPFARAAAGLRLAPALRAASRARASHDVQALSCDRSCRLLGWRGQSVPSDGTRSCR